MVASIFFSFYCVSEYYVTMFFFRILFSGQPLARPATFTFIFLIYYLHLQLLKWNAGFPHDHAS